MSVKYSWNRQNGAAMPSVRFMSIEPAKDYYKGMPLKLKEKGVVEPTDGDPEYICMAEYNPGAEIQPLDIPVQEVFPDVVYDRMNDDGSIEEVRFGGTGGGADVLNENGKLKNEVLPEGYPYEEEAQVLILENENVSMGPLSDRDGNALHLSAIVPNDTYTVIFDAESYTGVMKQVEDSTSDGGVGIEMFYDGASEDWSDAPFSLLSYSNTIYIYHDSDNIGPHSIKIYHHATTIVPMAEKFLPAGAGIKTAIIKSSDYDNFFAGVAPVDAVAPTYECINMTYDEAVQTMLAGEPLRAIVMFVSSPADNVTFAVNTVEYVMMGVSPLNSGEYMVGISYKEDLFTTEVKHGLTWTSDGITKNASDEV